MRYTEYCVEKNITIKEAMQEIDKLEPHIVFIVENMKLLASLTDGDVRRYLLGGGKISDFAISAANKEPLFANGDFEAAKIYSVKNYVAVPIVGIDGRICDVYIGSRKLTGKVADLKVPVVVNAGGRGTRLEPYTKILPKPLIPVGELPIIEHIMNQFEGYGCNRYHIIVNYKRELMKAYFADCTKKYDITWYDEVSPLGTGGGLCFLKGKLKETFFFSNCDNLLLGNYESMLRFHRKNDYAITMICAYKNYQIPYGVIEMNEDGVMEGMTEKPELSFMINTGIYIVEPEVLDDIDDNVPIGFPDIIEKQRKKGNKVGIYPVSENDWLDMGQMSELEKMRKRLYGE